MILDKEITEEDKNRISVIDTECLSDYFDDRFTFIKGIVREDNDIIVAGLGRVVNEFKIVVNPKFSKFKIAKAIKTLFDEAISWAGHSGSNETIVIITKGGKEYQEFLKSHFGFDEINGIPMRRDT